MCYSPLLHATHQVSSSMRNVLIVLLLAIFCLQATVMVVSDMAASAKFELSQTPADAEDEEDNMKASWAIEELSDYLPFGICIPRTMSTAPSVRTAVAVLRSIILPTLKPPPRG